MKCECKCIDTNNNIQMRQILRKAIFLSFFFIRQALDMRYCTFTKKHEEQLKQPLVACSAILRQDYRNHFFFYIFLFYIFFKELYTYCYKKMNIEGKSTAFRKKEMIF